MRFVTLLLFACVLSLLPRAAGADVFLSWNDCVSDGGAMDRTSACASDAGVNRLVASYVSPTTIPDFVAIDGIIDLTSEAAAIPDWWKFKNAGTCRMAAASLNIDVNNLPNFGANCADLWDAGASATGLFTAYSIGFGGDPNRAKAAFSIARNASNPTAMNSGTTYFAFIWQITNALTSTCTGCATPVALALNGLILYSVTPGVSVPASDGAGSQWCATWQTASAGTCTAVPVTPRTWGSVKAMYR